MSPKQNAFVSEYLIDGNATQAAIRAGYSERTAASMGYENLRKPEIAAAIAASNAARLERNRISADRVLEELARIAFFDPRRLLKPDGTPKQLHELDDDCAAAIAGLEVLEEFDGSGEDRVQIGVVKKYKLADKGNALSLAMRHLGMLQTKIDLKADVAGQVTYQANIPRRAPSEA